MHNEYFDYVTRYAKKFDVLKHIAYDTTCTK